MFEGCAVGELVAVVEETRLDESGVWARRMAAIAPVLAQRTIEAFDRALDDPDGDVGCALISGFVRTAAEIGPVLGVPPAAATKLVGYAEALDERMPLLFGLLASGRLDWASTKVILNRTGWLTRAAVKDLDRNLASRIARWDCWSRTRLLAAVDAAILTLDPDGAQERRVTADTERRATVKSLPNGMAQVRAYVSAPVGARVEARLEQMAAMVCAADPRTLMQRRADAIDAISYGSFVLACACSQPDCPAARPPEPAAGGGARCVINVIAPAATVTGDGDDPGFLQGYGVIDACQVRDLAAQPTTVLRDLINPDTTPATTPATATAAGGEVSGLLRHRPSRQLDRWVRCRGLTCSFPFCNRPAWRADLDHSVPFDHQNPLRGGWTMAANLNPKCRLHHRLKTFECGWRDEQFADGTVVWTSPTGRVYRSTPDGAELFDDLAHATPTSRPKPRPRDHRRDKARRIAAARAGTAAKRAANNETRRINQARAREIEDRQWRNEFRFKLLVFKGGPNTTGFCTWANDPPENNTITADWQPPPPPPTNYDDEPPF